MTNDIGDDMLNSLLEVQRTMSTELLQAGFPSSPSWPTHLPTTLSNACGTLLILYCFAHIFGNEVGRQGQLCLS
jgi:hypothetical protein